MECVCLSCTCICKAENNMCRQGHHCRNVEINTALLLSVRINYSPFVKITKKYEILFRSMDLRIKV